VERSITAPIELPLQGLPGMTSYRSISRYGLSVIYVKFADSGDILTDRTLVAQRMDQTALPAEVGTPRLGLLSDGLSEIYQFPRRRHRRAGDSALDAGRRHRDVFHRTVGQPDEPRRHRFWPPVDGAVVMIENIVRRRAKAPSLPAAQVVREAAHDAARPVAFAVAIITLIYLPILSLQGVEGKMFRPMALTVMFALVASLVLTLTLMPVLASSFLRNPRL
jgi:Cu/Ag efflux pump CusA